MNKKTKYCKPVKTEIDRDEMLFLLNNNICLKYLRYPQRARRVWTQWRERILTEWAKELPGSRPYAFWLFDVKEQRRAIFGTVDIYTRRPDIKKRYAFGCPTAYDYLPDGTPIETDFEPECDYLARLDLLTDAEKAIPLKTLRANSCDYIKRYDLDLAPVEKVLTRLGF